MFWFGLTDHTGVSETERRGHLMPKYELEAQPMYRRNGVNKSLWHWRIHYHYTTTCSCCFSGFRFQSCWVVPGPKWTTGADIFIHRLHALPVTQPIVSVHWTQLGVRKPTRTNRPVPLPFSNPSSDEWEMRHHTIFTLALLTPVL